MAHGSGVHGEPDTATAILDVAERLVQRRGFNGFSYADVAAELGITKASLHYHFAAKSDLGASLINRYSARFWDALAEIDACQTPADKKLLAYCDIFRAVLLERRMCLCGILAAEYETLPDEMRGSVISFFDRNHTWLSQLLRVGLGAGTLRYRGSPDEAAHEIATALEGAMLVSRPYGSTAILDAVTERLVNEFSASARSSRRPVGQESH